MLIIILIALLVTWIISMNIPKRIYCDGAEVAYVFSVSGFFIALIAFISILSIVLTEPTIDSKIELYQSQNAEIESKIQATVASYLAHERQTYKDLTPDNAIAVVSAYPELHSNELVKKQIEVYEDNNKKIMGLKEEKLNQSVYKWWLYFGR